MNEQRALRALRSLDNTRAQAAAERESFERELQEARRLFMASLKDARADAGAKYRGLQKDMQLERVIADEKSTRLEGMITELERALARARSALRGSLAEAAIAQEKVQAELEKAREGRIWARVNEEQERRKQAEEHRNQAQARAEEFSAELNARSSKLQAEKHELWYLRRRVKELEAKVDSYQVRSNRKFFEVEPIAEENERLRDELAAAHEETAQYKAIAEPNKSYFFQGAYTMAVDLAIGECITKARVSRNKVPLLFIIFARLFRVTLPSHKQKVPLKRLNGVSTTVERELLYVPGKTHVKEVCATLNQAHQLQVGTQLLESGDSKYTYIGPCKAHVMILSGHRASH